MNALVAPYSLLDYYFTSITTGVRALPGGCRREALARIVNPLSYPRYMEYQIALSRLEPLDGCRILDIGSPKLPALLLARHAGRELYATDIRDYFIQSTAFFLRRIGLGHRLGKDIHLEVQDARCLSYSDAFFDRIFSISVIEHIPDDGDTQAIREIERVLRPGGIVTLTVPFSAAGYYEEYVTGDVYERQMTTKKTFYQRHYDMDALRTRLTDVSDLRVVDISFFGEPGVQFERYWNRIPMRWKLPLLWAQPFLAKLFLRQLRPDQRDVACGVALTLIKSSSTVDS
jgi:SAM-dependent methyltransferase